MIQQQQLTQHQEVWIVAAEHSEGHPALLSPGETLHLLEGHVSTDTKLAQHPSVFLNLLTRELLLHHLYRADCVVNLINKMLEITQDDSTTITLSYHCHLCEVAKFQVPVSYSGAFPWIHHFHDDLQEGSFTRPILSHDTDT